METQSRIAIIGAASQLGKAILDRIDTLATSFSRSASDRQNHVTVADYHGIGAIDLKGVATVINCTGLRSGNDTALAQANVVLPARLAKAARDAGARRFIHVSSLSVFGHAECVGFDTPALPSAPYGRSKLGGDETLLALDSEDFAVIPVRLPAIIGPGRPNDKINRLIAVWRRLPAIPVGTRPVRRAMISFDLAARALIGLTDETRGGIRYAADPQPFTFVAAAEALRNAGLGGYRILPMPNALFAPLQVIVPEFYYSLWQESLLDPSANIATHMSSDLYSTIVAIARACRS